MLKINIENLTFSCIIGILDFERTNEQRVVINLSFEDFYNDKSKDFIDYSEVANFLETSMKERKFELIEDAILFLRKSLKQSYKIEKLWIKISKPDIMNNCIVSVEE